MTEQWKEVEKDTLLLISSEARVKHKTYEFYEVGKYFTAKFPVTAKEIFPDKYGAFKFRGNNYNCYTLRRKYFPKPNLTKDGSRLKQKTGPKDVSKHPNYDPTIYFFFNAEKGSIQECTRSEFKNTHRLRSYQVRDMLRRGRHLKGWEVIHDIELQATLREIHGY